MTAKEKIAQKSFLRYEVVEKVRQKTGEKYLTYKDMIPF